MKCSKCGAELLNDAKFCSYCGNKVERNYQKENGAQIPYVPGDGTIQQREDHRNLFNASQLMRTDRSFGGKKRNSTVKAGIAVAAMLLVVILVTLISPSKRTSDDSVAGHFGSDDILVANSTFDEIIPVVSSEAAIEPGTEYAYMSDAWNVYIAKAVSDDVIKVENWHKSSQSTKKLEYRSDLGSFRIREEQNGFSWVDDSHTAFTFIIQDKNNSDVKDPTAVIFTINTSDSDVYKGTNCDDEIACYSYVSDDWHTYRAIPLTDTLIKVECWYRTSSGFFDKHCFAWDVGVIDTKTTRTDFEWGDEEHTAFIITMKDPQNDSYWEEEKLTSFILENEDYKYPTVSSYLELSSGGNDNRTQINGFDTETNDVYELAGYIVEIPKYWKSESDIPGGIQRYAESGGKVAMLQISADEESDDGYPVTFDSLMDDNDNMIKAIESTSFSKVTDYEVIDTGVVKGILYKGTIKEEINGLAGYSEWFTFPSEEDRKWCTLIVCQTDNTDYLYTDDFMKMILSIKTNENNRTETEGAAEPEKPKSEYEKAYIRDMSDYDLYYMFDTETKSVVFFGTNDTYVEKGTYTGDFSTGVTITWSHGQWTESFTHKSGKTATLVDGSGWDWKYKVCDVEKAQNVLNGLQ